MTDSQRKFFYFPAWSACAKANAWREERGRLVADLDGQRADRIAAPAFEERVKVIELAEQFAQREHRAVKADDLRHACNYVASAGKTTHVEDLDNRATTMAVRLFRLLADPDNLEAVMVWLNPAEADRRDYADYMARTTNEAVLIAISKNAWETSNWRDQSLDQLRWLNQQAHRNKRPFHHRRKPECEPF
jgi:hypothetical protein